jgi:Uma2 family endonuclease
VAALGRTPSVLSQAEFEELDRLGQRVNDALRLEFIGGRISEQPMPDGNHGRIMQWLTCLCGEVLPGTWLFVGQGLRVGARGNDNVRAAGVLAPVDQFVGQGEWASPEGVLMVVEVTSYDRGTDRRDHVEKLRAYARAGVPVLLNVDRGTCKVTVGSESEDGRYGKFVTVPFGKKIALPDPVGMELDTEPLKDWVR